MAILRDGCVSETTSAEVALYLLSSTVAARRTSY